MSAFLQDRLQRCYRYVSRGMTFSVRRVSYRQNMYSGVYAINQKFQLMLEEFFLDQSTKTQNRKPDVAPYSQNNTNTLVDLSCDSSFLPWQAPHHQWLINYLHHLIHKLSHGSPVFYCFVQVGADGLQLQYRQKRKIGRYSPHLQNVAFREVGPHTGPSDASSSSHLWYSMRGANGKYSYCTQNRSQNSTSVCSSVVSTPACRNWNRILEGDEILLVLLLLMLLLLLLQRHERLADRLRFLAIMFSQ